MRYPKLREVKEAVISLFTRPYTSKFPFQPHTPYAGFRGKPVVNENTCVGCETCTNVCPAGAITFKDDLEKKIRTIERDVGKCIFCGKCEEHCITRDGVKLDDKSWDLVVFDPKDLIESQEHELITCDSCGVVITTKAHMEFIHNKLGPKAYSSILNLNMLNERLNLATGEEVTIKVKDGLKRKDMFGALCPNCMRKVQVKNMV